ncbi:MAG TPA: SCO family protein [Bacteroidota bacterium]|nr:SCO family protein [Bacteroidota bacterium]
MKTLALTLACLVSLLTAGCTKNKQTDLVTFPLRGEIVRIDSVKLTLTVAHQAIPNYMNAMTMPFKVHDAGLLRPLAVGDSIQATLAVSHTESWLEQIAVVGQGEAPPPLTGDQIITARVLRTGEMFPDESLLNQEGKTVRLSAFRGSVLALTFIYTRCPLPDFCIRMSNQFARIQKSLKEDAHLNGKWHLLSVSFDPKFDRPGVLQRYASEYGADFSTWDFLTDPDSAGPAIRRLADGLGLEYSQDEGLIDHNLRTVLIDPEGRLVKVITGNEWKPEDLAATIKRLIPGA